MYGKTFHVNVRVDGNLLPCAHEVSVCTAGNHFSYTMRVRMMGNLMVAATIEESVNPLFGMLWHPCDGTCRRPSPLAIRENVMPSLAVHGEPECSEEEWCQYYLRLLDEARRIHPEEDLVSGRRFGHTHSLEGNEHVSKICTGRVHLLESWSPDSAGSWFAVGGHCNHFDCRPVRIRLPRVVERAVRKDFAQ